MSTAVPRYVPQMAYIIHTSHPHTDGAHVCQAAYTISKDVHHSLMSLIGTAKRDRQVRRLLPPPHQPVFLVLSRHGRTDEMAMKDALRGWSGGGPMHAQRWIPAHWVATPQCQPTKADSQCGHYWTTLTTPLHGPHCRTPVPGPSPVTLPDRTGAIHIIHQRCCTLLCPFPANPLSKAVPPTWISTTTPGRRRLSLLL